MGCGGSTPAKDPPPNGAPETWKDTVTSTFKLLDKPGTGSIVLVSYKVKETKFSEISALGDDLMEKQKAIGDFETALDGVNLETWTDLIKEKITAKGWVPVAEFLAAIDAAVADGKRNTCDAIAKTVFKTMDEGWAEPAKTGELDFVTECEALGDKTDKKAAALIEGLVKETKIKIDAWSAHCNGKVETLGWPRAQMMLKVLEARLEKVADAGDVVAGMG